MQVKVIQEWPITYQMTQYAPGGEFEADEETARELIKAKRVVAVESLKTNANPDDVTLSSEERAAKIRTAIKELLSEAPNEKPKCPDISAKTGIKDVRAAERDAILAEVKGN